MTVRAVVLLVATTLAGCTTLANGTINRRLETRLRPGAAPVLVIEDLERSLRQYVGADLVAIHTPLRGRRSEIELVG
ncbi:MAG TPA: hypothetical protein VK427_20200, partial [Kofleriaceae bacterium]|nr:hypothetical protein [Kofleriaceae bacterium]